MPFSVFISSSHHDRELRKELEKHLSNLKRQNIITSWYDGDISPGTEWQSQIIEHLNTDQIILLLISADFMDSDFCYSVEMTQAIARHEANQARVLPIILRPTDWRGAAFAKLKVLPTDGKAVTRWPTYDDACEDIVQGIREAIADLTKQAQQKRQANMKGAFQPINEYKQTWLFQANPKVWHDFHENFKPQVGATGDWTVSRYKKEIDPGDRVLLWEAGSRGGLLAIGELTGEPFEQDPSIRRTDEQVKPVWKVLFQYTHILKEPIQRSTFLKDTVLRKMHHIRAPQGSNFKVTEEEWKVLQKLINQQP